MSQADEKINYYESSFRTSNPYNPHKMLAEFNIAIVDDSQLMQMRDKMKREVGVKVDECLVIEGCETDDRIVLGGKDAFLSHFCTYFNFNACYSNEQKAAKQLNKYFNDSDKINKSIDKFITSMDRRI